MDCGITDRIATNQFRSLIDLDVIFISVDVLVILFEPTSISVFLSEFIGLLLPRLGNFALFDLFVFPTGIALPRNLHNTGINNLTPRKKVLHREDCKGSAG